MRLFKSKNQELIDRMHPIYYAIPAMTVYFIFFLLPILLNVGYSFTNWTAFFKEVRFVGFENYRNLFNELRILNVAKNTFVYTITVSFFQNLFGFILAMALYKRTLINSIFRGIIFFPCLVSMVVWGQLYSSILDPKGILNTILSKLLFTDISVGWLGSRYFTLIVVAFVNVWVWTGFTMMIYITSINTIPSEIIDAGDIDGINWMGRVRHVIVPLIMPGITINVLITLIGSMKEFDVIQVLTKGGPGRSTEVFNTLIYEKVSTGLFGYGAALNLFLIILIAALALPLYNRMSKRIVEL